MHCERSKHHWCFMDFEKSLQLSTIKRNKLNINEYIEDVLNIELYGFSLGCANILYKNERINCYSKSLINQAKCGNIKNIISELEKVRNHDAPNSNVDQTYDDEQISQIINELVQNDDIEASASRLANILDRAPAIIDNNENRYEMYSYNNIDTESKETRTNLYNTH